MTRRREDRRRGFTLLEVLVAVTILGIGISAVLSSQWVSMAAVKHSRLESEAVGLARCRMSEVEWSLEQDGFPLTDEDGRGPCCDGQDHPNMTCTWTITKPEFPNGNFGELNLDSELDFGGSAGPNLLGGPSGGSAAPGAGALSFLKTGQAGMSKQSGDVSDVADSFLGDGEGTDGIAALIMQIVYPDLKAVFESGTRKAVVRVVWYEGNKEYAVEVEQWIVSSKEAGLGANLNGLLPDDEEDDGAGASGGKGGSGGSGGKGGKGGNGGSGGKGGGSGGKGGKGPGKTPFPGGMK